MMQNTICAFGQLMMPYILAFLKNAIKMLLQKKNDARKVLQ
jgi:hypothetical protein